MSIELGIIIGTEEVLFETFSALTAGIEISATNTIMNITLQNTVTFIFASEFLLCFTLLQDHKLHRKRSFLVHAFGQDSGSTCLETVVNLSL